MKRYSEAEFECNKLELKSQKNMQKMTAVLKCMKTLIFLET